MKKLLTYYSFVVVNILVVVGFVGATSTTQLLLAMAFFPLAVYFWLLIAPKRRKAFDIPDVSIKPKKRSKKPKKASSPESIQGKSTKKTKVAKLKREEDALIQDEEEKIKFDKNRRSFVKLIGSAGVSVFLFSMFTKRAQGAFFGSVPGPGIIGLKDASDVRIDPSKHHPTDGYRLAELDDSTPAYYGFTRSDAYWFIIREGSGGDFRYATGTSSFPTNWTSRATLSYGYYDDEF